MSTGPERKAAPVDAATVPGTRPGTAHTPFHRRRATARGRSLTGIAGLDPAEITDLLARAARAKARLASRLSPLPLAAGRPRPLAGRRILTLFFENSTRTVQSFHIAARCLGAEAMDLPVARSSVQKGESLRDTLRTCAAMGVDAVILRHPTTGAAAYAASVLDIPVINAGDGTGEHPTQALLDALTILEHKDRLAGLKVAIVGDVRHSRVARSNVLLLTRLGARVWLCGPPSLLPAPGAFPGVEVTTDLAAALAGADVVMALRIQRERLAGSVPDLGEYRRGWGIDLERLRWARPDALIMHPGPVNRGVELAPEVMALPRCVIETQVTNGVAARMAVLEWALAPAAPGGEGWA